MAQQEQQNNPVDCKRNLIAIMWVISNLRNYLSRMPHSPETGHTSNNIITLAFGILALMSGLALTFMRNSKH